MLIYSMICRCISFLAKRQWGFRLPCWPNTRMTVIVSRCGHRHGPSIFPMQQPWYFTKPFAKITSPTFKKISGRGKTRDPNYLRCRRLSAHASQGRHPIIPVFHHSIIPIVSAANQVLYLSASQIIRKAHFLLYTEITLGGIRFPVQ